MPERSLRLLVPGDLESRTGGYGYDREIVAGLRRRGWHVSVVTLAGGYPEPTAAECFAAEQALAAIPDEAIVLADGLAFGALPFQAARERSRLRFVALVHHPLTLETGLDPSVAARLRVQEREALASARGVVVTSRRTVAAVEEFGVPRDRIAVVEPGTDVALEARGSESRTLELLCVASLTPRKGHATLLAALAALGDLPWRLTCVGSGDRDPDTTAELRRLCAFEPLHDRVRFVGELGGGELEDAYDRADLFVLPTLYEGYGMAVAEALARAIPVLSTPTGAIEDLVGDEAGLLVPAGNVTALTAALRQLMSDPHRLGALRAGARLRRGLLPTWDAASAAMEAAIWTLVEP